MIFWLHSTIVCGVLYLLASQWICMMRCWLLLGGAITVLKYITVLYCMHIFYSGFAVYNGCCWPLAVHCNPQRWMPVSSRPKRIGKMNVCVSPHSCLVTCSEIGIFLLSQSEQFCMFSSTICFCLHCFERLTPFSFLNPCVYYTCFALSWNTTIGLSFQRNFRDDY